MGRDKLEFEGWGIVLDTTAKENNIMEYTTLVISGVEASLVSIHKPGEVLVKKGQFVYINIEKNEFRTIDALEVHKEIVFEVIKELLVKDSKGIVKPNVDDQIRDFCTAVSMKDMEWAQKSIENWDLKTVKHLKNIFYNGSSGKLQRRG